MKLLLLESIPDVAATIKAELADAGHEVATCYEPEHNGPCRGVVRAADCPLANGHADLAIVARRADEPDTLFEMGAVCAERHRSPVVHIDPAIPAAEVADVVRRAAAAGKDRIEAAYAAAVRAALADPTAGVEANRSGNSVQIKLTLDSPDSRHRAAMADSARAAVRDFDAFVKVIDVAVTTRPSTVG